jgi:hypothetical protein
MSYRAAEYGQGHDLTPLSATPQPAFASPATSARPHYTSDTRPFLYTLNFIHVLQAHTL